MRLFSSLAVRPLAVRPLAGLAIVAVLGGAIRVGTPFLFVSLGECLTEKSGRINLGLEGVLVLSAMAGFGGSYLTGSAWVGVLVAGCSGALLALLHGLLCSLDRVNDIATGIALILALAVWPWLDRGAARDGTRRRNAN